MNLEVKKIDVKSSRDENELLIDNLNFTIGNGEILLLVGESGSGKTTILKSIVQTKMNLIKDFDVNYFGKQFNKSVFESDLSYIPQNYPLFEEISIEDNVMASFVNSKEYLYTLYSDLDRGETNSLSYKETKKYIRKNHLKQNKDNVEKIISSLFSEINLDYKSLKSDKPTKLSGGERQRLSIACALLKKPKLIIMDEPFANLDNKTSEMILTYIKGLKQSGISFLISTHDIDLLEGHEDSSILLSGSASWTKGNISSLKKIRDEEWIVKYFNNFYSLSNNKYYLPTEIEFVEPKDKNRFAINKFIEWKNGYIYELGDKENKIFVFSKNIVKNEFMGVKYKKK